MLQSLPRNVKLGPTADAHLLRFNSFGNFTCSEQPIFNKHNWLVQLHMYCQIVDPPMNMNTLTFDLTSVQLWWGRWFAIHGSLVLA